MNERLEQIRGELFSLPLSDRALLAQALLESLNGESGITEKSNHSCRSGRDLLVGALSDESELLDLIVEDALLDRERQILR